MLHLQVLAGDGLDLSNIVFNQLHTELQVTITSFPPDCAKLEEGGKGSLVAAQAGALVGLQMGLTVTRHRVIFRCMPDPRDAGGDAEKSRWDL